MRITLMDRSVAFDGETPKTRALGGAEKALVNLAAALAARGHEVTVFNNCDAQAQVDGVTWLPFDSPRPMETDIVIAHRKPELLGEVAHAGIRILWLWGDPRTLNEPANQELCDKWKPVLAFVGEHQRGQWRSWRNFPEVVIQPGVGDDYLSVAEVEAPPPVAVITTHPLHGLTRMVRLWRDRIATVRPAARLQVFSASLYRASGGGAVPDRLADVFDEVVEAAEDGVEIAQPGGDHHMARAFAGARAHLYPSIPGEMYCATLAETQAAGVPAVVMSGSKDGAGAAAERVRNGRTGYLVPDDDAFVNIATELLSDDFAMYNGMCRDARVLQRGRGWEAVAIDFEGLWT